MKGIMEIAGTDSLMLRYYFWIGGAGLAVGLAMLIRLLLRPQE